MGLINTNLAQHPYAIISLSHFKFKIWIPRSNATHNRKALPWPKTIFYTCEVAEQNKITFYPTTQNQGILKSTRNYTLHNVSNIKPHLKRSNVPLLRGCPETLTVLHPWTFSRPNWIKPQATWSCVHSQPFFEEEVGLGTSRDHFQPELSYNLSQSSTP